MARPRVTLADTDPRVPGGVYWSGYWQEPYRVLAMWTPADANILWFQVMWLGGQHMAGRVVAHCTTWDRKRDRVVSVPGMA